VYVACTDSKLYCIDRASGRLKWQYFAGTPLRTQPVVTADAVYQFVPGKGLVAIDKTTGKDFREPLWVAPAAGRFLSQDDKNVYVRSAEGNVAALDRKTGEPKFKSRRTDITVFAWPNTKDSTIYAATPKGEVIAIKPVTTPGDHGAGCDAFQSQSLRRKARQTSLFCRGNNRLHNFGLSERLTLW
jgi:outer membrane protein assembly factor BamB